jgi:hypothetical protein
VISDRVPGAQLPEQLPLTKEERERLPYPPPPADRQWVGPFL